MKHFAGISSLLVATSLALFAAPNVWVTGSLNKIKATDAAGTATSIMLYAAQGEYESLQVGIQGPAGGLSNVNVAASNLTGPGGAVIPSSNLTLFRENYVNIPAGQTSLSSADGNPCTECPTGAGIYPDGLIPFTDPDTGVPLPPGAALQAVPFSVSAAQNQVIWVDIYVPRTATAGQYSGTISITSAQGSAQVSVTLNVWNFSLPVRPSMKSSFSVWDAAHQVSTDKELLRNRLMTDATTGVQEATALVPSGLTSNDLNYYSGGEYGHCSTTTAPPTVSQAQSGAHPFQQLNLLVFDYSFDEIDNCTSLFPTVIQWAQNLHAAGVSQLVTMAPNPALYSDGTGSGRSAVDIWAMLPDGYNSAQAQSPPRVTTVLAKGDQAWSYQTLVQDDYSPKWLIDFNPVGMRLHPGFINQSLGLSGLLYWQVDGWLSGTGAGSWSNINYQESGNSYAGEGVLVYPGEAVGMAGKVAPSMRLKYLRDGADDYEYIQILKNLGQGAWALQVAATVGPNWNSWSQNPAAVEAARITLGQMINSLMSGNSQPLLGATPAALQFSAPVNGAPTPAFQNVALSTSSGAAANYTVAASTSTGNWLLPSSLQGTTPGSLGITVNPSGLPAGTYSGSVVVASNGTSNAQTIPVSLVVIAPVTVTASASPTSLAFSQTAGGSPTTSKTLKVSSSTGTLPVTATVSTSSGGAWLTVTSSGTTPASLKVVANGGSNSPGIYTGTIQITVPGAANGPISVPVTLTIQRSQRGGR